MPELNVALENPDNHPSYWKEGAGYQFSRENANPGDGDTIWMDTSGVIQVTGGVEIGGIVKTGNSIRVQNAGSSATVFRWKVETGTAEQNLWDWSQFSDGRLALRSVNDAEDNAVEGLVLYRNGLNIPRVHVPITTDSTSTTTGALTVAGGVGIDKNLNVGGTAQVSRAGNGAPDILANDNVTGHSAFAVVRDAAAGPVHVEAFAHNTGPITLELQTLFGGDTKLGGALNVGGVLKTESAHNVSVQTVTASTALIRNVHTVFCDMSATGQTLTLWANVAQGDRVEITAHGVYGFTVAAGSGNTIAGVPSLTLDAGDALILTASAAGRWSYRRHKLFRNGL